MALRFVEPRFVAVPEWPLLQWLAPSNTDRTTGAYDRWPLWRCGVSSPPTRASGGGGDPSPQRTMDRPYERSAIFVKLKSEAHQ
jgi:hypothetical protein